MMRRDMWTSLRIVAVRPANKLAASFVVAFFIILIVVVMQWWTTVNEYHQRQEELAFYRQNIELGQQQRHFITAYEKARLLLQSMNNRLNVKTTQPMVARELMDLLAQDGIRIVSQRHLERRMATNQVVYVQQIAIKSKFQSLRRLLSRLATELNTVTVIERLAVEKSTSDSLAVEMTLVTYQF